MSWKFKHANGTGWEYRVNCVGTVAGARQGRWDRFLVLTWRCFKPPEKWSCLDCCVATVESFARLVSKMPPPSPGSGPGHPGDDFVKSAACVKMVASYKPARNGYKQPDVFKAWNLPLWSDFASSLSSAPSAGHGLSQQIALFNTDGLVAPNILPSSDPGDNAMHGVLGNIRGFVEWGQGIARLFGGGQPAHGEEERKVREEELRSVRSEARKTQEQMAAQNHEMTKMLMAQVSGVLDAHNDMTRYYTGVLYTLNPLSVCV